MSISTAELRAWLSGESLPTSLTALSKMTGISRETLKNQSDRERMAEATVIEIARASGRHPISVLSCFSTYTNISSNRRGPSRAELLSQIHLTDLMVEFLARTSKPRAAHIHHPRLPLMPFPHPGSVKAWIEAIDPGTIRKAMTLETGVTASNLSSQISQNRLSPSLAYAASRAGNVSPASGFVITGLLTPDEAGWAPRAREVALQEVTTAELVEVVSVRLRRFRNKSGK